MLWWMTVSRKGYLKSHHALKQEAPPSIRWGSSLVIVNTFLIFLTELTSNMATTQAILPILVSISVAMKINPLLIMIPATISASCAFMLPVATAPNAIVFGSERLKIAHMAKSGFIINIICIFIISIFSYIFLPFIFNISYSEFPEWAEKN
jgi:sodium-dependent dicarboxylate transporter 2/3/5